MIIVMKPNAPIEERNKIIAGLEAKGFKIDLSTGNQAAILGVVGDTSTL
ncbi:MAG: 3-deoxy-7-phosphoheptulonate synthase, partial [Acidaminococcaceae bacterium]|nr:3-deoxy-7-phosphoheptulonate synthase [Acidaminococcaceae bacterium]